MGKVFAVLNEKFKLSLNFFKFIFVLLVLDAYIFLLQRTFYLVFLLQRTFCLVFLLQSTYILFVSH